MTDKIAVIGFAGRFPGAPGIDDFWDLLVAGRSGLTRFTDAELAARGVPSSLRRHPGYVPVGGVIDGYDQFDPVPFGIGEAEAEVLDPQQRVFLECAWHALEHAGHGGGRSAGTVGVFAGAALSAYLLTNLAHRFDPVGGADPAGSLSLHTANVAAYLPMRTAYRLGLTGPALSVGATCATSLVAVHVAVQSLLGGECDTALAGGVSLRDPLGTGYLSVPDGPFSSDGHTRPYSARATGTVFTQGAGVVVLRRLSDALADGDFVHAVILGSAVGNDGAERAGFTAPSPSGQARTIAEALAVSGVEPREISYIEGHGTGTILGDPIEVQALRRVFGPANAPWCALGSVKGNIGHADSAAGIAGLIKTVLALREGVLPASLHAAEPNPELKLDGSAFRLVTRTEPWQADGVRRAGVSSFGMGGTNCHVILEAPPAPARPAPDDRAHLLLVSGVTAQACRDTAHALADGFAARKAPAELADFAHTLAGGRVPMAVRAAVVAGPGDDVAAALRGAAPAPPVAGKPRVVFTFPGGGAQFTGMAARLHADEPVFAAAIDRLSEVFRSLLDADPRGVLLAAPGDERIRALARDPAHGLPALFIASVAMAELLGHYGVRPDAVLGHSAGEYAAATVAGVLSEQDAALLVARRSALMSGLPSGAMLALAMSEDQVRGLLRRHPEVDLAAVNGPDACVVSGPAEAVSALRDELEAAGLPARDVAIDVAAHSRLVEPAMPGLRVVTAGLSPRPPRIPLVTTVTGAVATEAELADPEHWVRHLRSTVHFAAALENALADGPAVVVQAGPGAGLATLAAARGVSGMRAAVTTYPAADANPDGRPAILHALGQLWTHGAEIDHPATTGTPRRRVPLPGYAFTRRRFWAEPPADAARLPGADAAEPGPDEPFQVPAWSQLPPQSTPRILNGEWWLVLGDGTRADAVRAEFAARGAVTRDPASDADWTALSGIISMLGCDQPAAGQEQAQLKRVLGEYQRLAAAVPASLEPGSLPFLQVTIGGERVIGDEPVTPPASAVGGLPRVLAQEVPALRWQTLDLLASADGPAVARNVLTEIADLTAGARELAVRGARRWIHHWQPWHPPRDEAPAGVGGEPVVVVIGGLGRVGLALAERLCAVGRPRLVLASRSGLPPEEDTAGDPVLARRLDVVRRLRAEGYQVRVATVDAADSPAVRELLARVAAEYGRIDLVVYAPVTVELTPFAEWDDGTVGAVLTPKVAGALALRDAVGGLDAAARPASVVLMASAAGSIGGFGLSAYVAGSRFLDGLAASLDGEQAGTRWLAADWDRWRFGTADERESVAEITMRHALDAEDALTALLRLTGLAAAGQAPAQVAVSPGELNSRSTGLGGRTVRAAGPADGTLATPAQRLVATILSEVLGRPVTSPDDDFFALGGHSLLATRVLARFRDEHGVTVRLRDLLAAPTVAGLADLVSAAAPAGPTEVVATTGSEPRPADTGTFPLTRVQHAYWVGRTGAYELGEVGCHFFLEHECRDLDLDRYERAWNRVIERHEMLRAVIVDGQNQVLRDVPRYRIPVTDLSGAGDTEAARRLGELRDRLSHRVAAPDRWPLIEVHAVRLPGGAHHVLLSVDVLVCDSASYQIVDREIRRLYLDPDASLPPVGMTFEAYVRGLGEQRRDPDHERAAAYWRPRIAALPDAPALPTGDPDGPVRFARRREVVPAGQWQRLRDRAAGLGVTPTALLLTAYADVLAQWSGSPHFSLTLTVFDRPPVPPGLDRVVGEFSSLTLLEVDQRAAAPFADRARAVQERLFADLDHREFSGLELLSERATSTGRQWNVPVVFTGMLGLDRLGDAGEPHDYEWLGPVLHGVSQTPQVWLDHQVYEQLGCLVLQWDVNESALDGAAADTAFAAYVRWLRDLADAPELWTDAEAAPRASEPVEAGTGEERTAAEQELAKIWAELLDLDPESVPDDASFLSLGGDSLLAVRMAALVRQRLGVVLGLPDVRPTLTLRELAEVARRDGGGFVRRPVAVRLRRRLDPEAPFPLLPLQQAYFVGQQGGWELSHDSAHFYTDVPLSDVDGDAAPAALTSAAVRLMMHQPMLRARILPDGTQRILPADDPETGDPPVIVLDLRDADEAAAARALEQVRAEMGEHGPDPQHGPGFAVRLTLLPGQAGRLHIALNLAIADGWSAQLFARELAILAADPNAVLPPLLTDFGDYVTAIGELAATDDYEQDRRWWTQRLPGLPEAPALPLVTDPEQVRARRMGSRDDRLGAPSWAEFRRECAARELTPSTVLFTVYAAEVARLAGHRRFLLNTLQFNRYPLHPDVDRTIGAFSSTTLVPVYLETSQTFTDMAHAAERPLSDALAHSLVSGVEVTRDLARLRGTHRPVAPVVFQSGLGVSAAVGAGSGGAPPSGPLGALDDAEHYHRIRTPQVMMELRFYETAGELRVSLATVDELFDPASLDGLLAAAMREIRGLAAGDGWDDVVALPEAADKPAATVLASPEPDVPRAGEPAGETERAIATLWAKTLGLDAVDRADSFFALGGDSLLAIRMLRELTAGRETAVSPAAFLTAPTVAGLAAALDAGEDAARAVAEDVIVPLREGTGTPLFLVHPSGGDVLCYVELSRRLSTPNPVIALADPELSGHPGAEGVPEMATTLLAALRRHQPHGPYMIGGWSMGGILAHHLACELRARGEEVRLLVMIDSNSPELITSLAGLDAEGSATETRLRHLRSVAAFLDVDVAAVADDADGVLAALAAHGVDVPRDTWDRQLGVFARHLRGLAAHQAGRLDASVPAVLLRATRHSPSNGRIGMGVDDAFADPALGWRPHVASEPQVHWVDAHHYSILRGSAVAEVAAHIDEAVRQSGTARPGNTEEW